MKCEYFFADSGWTNTLGYDNYVEFNYHVESTVIPAIDNQVFRIYLQQDTIKTELVLDISESMASNINGTTNTCFNELKDAVNKLVLKLEMLRQLGDSIGITYYNSEIIQPNPANFPKDFIAVTHPYQPPTSATVISICWWWCLRRRVAFWHVIQYLSITRPRLSIWNVGSECPRLIFDGAFIHINC